MRSPGEKGDLAEFDLVGHLVCEADAADREHHSGRQLSSPLRRPAATASRTAFSISRCEVMPTFFRNLRRLLLKTSSFMRPSWHLRVIRMVQHVFAEVALAPVGTGIELGTADVAILAAGDVFG